MLNVAMTSLLPGLLALCALASSVAAQTYPTKAIRLIVPLAQGGPADAAARVFAPVLAESLGQNVLVENRAGASGVVGTEAVIGSAPDGYTLLFGSSSVFAVNPAVMTDLRFDVRREITLIGLVATTEFMIAARPGLGVANVGDLVKKAKAEPGKLSYGSSGAGGVTHLGSELFNMEAGLNILHIPYRGGGPALIGALSNDVDMGMFGIGTMLQHLKSGKLIGIGTASAKRSALAPDVPSFAEAGYPNVEVQGWYGLGAPAKTPAAIVKVLDAATAKISSSAGFQSGLAKVGLEPLSLNATAAAPFIERELEKWAKVAKAANIQLKP